MDHSVWSISTDNSPLPLDYCSRTEYCSALSLYRYSLDRWRTFNTYVVCNCTRLLMHIVNLLCVSVSVCACVWVWECVLCMCMCCMCICVHVRVCACACVYVHVGVGMRVWVCPLCTHTWVCAHVTFPLDTSIHLFTSTKMWHTDFWLQCMKRHHSCILLICIIKKNKNKNKPKSWLQESVHTLIHMCACTGVYNTLTFSSQD